MLAIDTQRNVDIQTEDIVGFTDDGIHFKDIGTDSTEYFTPEERYILNHAYIRKDSTPAEIWNELLTKIEEGNGAAEIFLLQSDTHSRRISRCTDDKIFVNSRNSCIGRTTWRRLIDIERTMHNDGPILLCTISDTELDTLFQPTHEDTQGLPFRAWSEKRIYFSTAFYNYQCVNSVSILPSGEPIAHISFSNAL